MLKENYRPDELAEAIGISVWTIYRMIKKEQIKHLHFGHTVRIPKDEYLRILREGLPKLPTTANYCQ